MKYYVLIADDNEAVRNSHIIALKHAAASLDVQFESIEAENSVQTRELIRNTKYDLIILDDDFKDEDIKGRLSGSAILQMARKSGPNTGTTIIFCTGEKYETLRPMVEKFNAEYLSKAQYNLEDFSNLLKEKLKDTQ